jgi:hypothetical protein
MHTEFLTGNVKEIHNWEDLGEDMILKLILKKQDDRFWTGFIWLKLEASGRL